MSSFFDIVPKSPSIEDLVQEEDSSDTIDLTIKAYRDENGEPYVFPIVKEVKLEYAQQHCQNYLPILGHEGFTKLATELVLSDDSPAIRENRVLGIQCLSGTGALRSGAEFLAQVMGLDTVYLCDMSLENQAPIFKNAGFSSLNTYSYLNADKKSINMEGLLADLERAPEKSVIVLHSSAHNPTGLDPTRKQWNMIAEVIKRRNLFTFFELAEQGFATGYPFFDTMNIKHFVNLGLEFFVAQSFSRNFGLYSERVGNLIIVANDPLRIANIPSQMTLVNVSKFSNPPAYGACIVHRILSSARRRYRWYKEITAIHQRLKEMRKMLVSKLTKLETPGTWDHLLEQTGLFSSSGLSEAQVEHLMLHHKVLMFENGCFSVSGLNARNMDQVARAIDDTVRTIA